MWYFHVMVCLAGTMNCIFGHMPVPQASSSVSCYYQTADWVRLMSEMKIGQHYVDVSFKCEKNPEDVMEQQDQNPLPDHHNGKKNSH